MRSARAVGRWAAAAAQSCPSSCSRVGVRRPAVAAASASSPSPSSTVRPRGASTAAAPSAHAESSEKASSPPPPPPPIAWTTHRLAPEQVLKVDKIFHKVLWLDMIETALLVELVNKKVGRIGLGPKQRAALERRMEALEGGGGGGGPGGSPAAEEAKAAEEAGPKLVDVKLAGFDGKQKIKVIKEVRSLLGLGLKEAKELVESAPKVLSKQIKPEDADEIRRRLEAAGAEVEVS